MSLSRRTFVRSLGLGAAGALGSSWVGARGREALAGSGLAGPLMAGPADWAGKVILSSNENPLGPGKAVLDSVWSALGAEGRKPGRYPGNHEALAEAIAHKFGVKPENVLIGCGSTQILRTATQVFTSKTRPLVGSLPTYEECSGYAELIGSPVKGVALDSALRMDLNATLAAAKGAGMVFYCNPNNPTATLVSASDTADFVDRVLKSSPETTILVDEAYYDYVTDPSHRSLIPLAVENQRVVVARTFSKIYGMAGLRIGYGIAHAETIKKMAAWEAEGSQSVLSIAAAIAAIEQDPSYFERERARNKAARDFTREFFRKAGYKDTESQTNFIFVDVRRPIEKFQAACKERGILVGRPFPPMTTYARISIGTIEEMQKAVEVFREVLAMPAASAAA